MNEHPLDGFTRVMVAAALLFAVCTYLLAVRVGDLEEELRVNKQAAAATETNREVILLPRCPEDTVLVGAGEYEGGRWSSYVCGGAADDYRWHE